MSVHRLMRGGDLWLCGGCEWSAPATLGLLDAGGDHDDYGPRHEDAAKAWDEGWIAGCNDQQYGDENAHPWTPNPYRAHD